MGKLYYRMVESVLARDKNWVRWKQESCPKIERVPMPAADYTAAVFGAKKATQTRKIRENPMGALNLSFLSDTENVNGLETLVKTDGLSRADPEQYLDGIVNTDLDMEMADTDTEKQDFIDFRAAQTWRLLRLAARSKFRAFEEIDEGNTDTMKVLSAAAQTKGVEVQELSDKAVEPLVEESMTEPHAGDGTTAQQAEDEGMTTEPTSDNGRKHTRSKRQRGC